MKKILYVFFLLFSVLNFTFASEVDDKLANLQRQINELKRQTSSSKSSSLELPFEIHGRFAMKNTTFDASKELKKNNGGSLSNDTSIDMGRIGFFTSADGFDYGIEFNYNTDDKKIELYDATVSKSFGNHTFTVGRGFIQVSMENDQSGPSYGTDDYSHWLNVPSLAYGLFYSYTGSQGAVFLSVHGDNDAFENSDGNEFVGTAFRGFVNPIKTKDFIVHLGVDAGYYNLHRDSNNNLEIKAVESTYESELDDAYYFAGEIAMQYKFVTFQTEGMWKYYEHYSDYRNLYSLKEKDEATGLTAQLTVGLTGENREYSSSGSFNYPNVKNPVNKGGFGALELYARYERWNDKNKNKNNEVYNIESMPGYLYAVGLNWFPVNSFEVLLNYARVKDNSLNSVNGEKKEYNRYQIESRFHF